MASAGKDWVSDPSTIPQIPFIGKPGLRVAVPTGGGTPIDYFYLLADPSFFDLIIKETNANAEIVFQSDKRLGENSKITHWKELTKPELSVFIALVFHMGSIQLPKMRDYWRTDVLYNFACFRSCMNRNRFLIIMRCLNFPEDKPTPKDRLYKIRPLVNFFNKKMNIIYSPEKNLSMDETMLVWKGRMSYREYVNKNKQKCGLKFCLLMDSNGIILNAEVNDSINKESDVNIVLSLMKEKMNKGHSVYMDKSYSSFSLAKTLLTNKTYCTGTLRSGRKDNPTEVVKSKLKNEEVIARYCDNVCVGKLGGKSEMLYLSTEHKNDLEKTSNENGKEKLKPKPVMEYHKNMLGFDLQDQILSYYSSHRKAIQWHKKAGLHLMEMMLFNAFMLYNKFSGKTLQLSDFRDAIVKALLLKCSPKPKKVVAKK